jgi:hypothetical protein
VLDRRHRAVWWGLAAAIAGLVALGTAQVRFTAFSQLLATVAWGWLAATLVARVEDRRGLRGSLLRVGSMFAGVAGFLVPVILLALLSDPDPGGTAVTADCDLDEVVAFVNDRGGEPVVVTHIDWGPEILYRTDASVLASPYHRNVDGILDARRFMGGSPGEAARIAGERSVDLVAVCEERDGNYLGSDRTDGDLLSLVAEGRTPTWLIERPMQSDVRLFEVDGSRLP